MFGGAARSCTSITHYIQMTVDALISSFGSKLDLDISVARAPETGEPMLESDEDIKLSKTSVTVILGSDSEAGTGTLYITTRCYIVI